MNDYLGFLIGFSFSLICYSNGLQENTPILVQETMDLEALPLEKLLEMKKELRIKDERLERRTDVTGASEPTVEEDAPNAMALRRTTNVLHSSAGSPMQTAFQMSLTVLSFLAFGGYVISLVAQNMRSSMQSIHGATPPQPLKAVIVNQKKRLGLQHRPPGHMTTVSFGRRKRSRRFQRTMANWQFLEP